MIEAFLLFLQYEKRFSQHTLQSYKTDLTQFTTFANDEFSIEDISQVDYPIIRSWIVHLNNAKQSPRTINRKIACLKSYYKYLLLKEAIKKDPSLKLQSIKAKKTLPTFVEETHLRTLLDTIPSSNAFLSDSSISEKPLIGLRDKCILETLYGTGIRLSELIYLQEKDINLFDSTLKVMGKGKKERLIPINKSLMELLKQYISLKKYQFLNNNSEYLIVTDKGEQTYPMFIHRVVNKWLDYVTTIDKKSPHVLRHSFATHLLNKGADLNAIKELLGHTSLAATQVYTHNSIEKLKNIFEQAHPKA